MKEKINVLYNKDDKEAYCVLKELELLCSESDELYQYFDEFLNMLVNEKSYVKVRGYSIICSLAKYDKENKINNDIEKIIKVFDDNVSTSIRQYLAKTNILILYKPELSDIIIEKIKKMDISGFKETMISLINRDIDNILKNN